MADNHLKELAIRAGRGDEAAQQAVLLQIYPIVHKHLGFLLTFDRSTEDAVQESMLQIYQALPGYRGDASPTSWALRIATRTARRYIGREKSKRGDEAQSLVEEIAGDASEQWVELASLLQILPAKKRQAMVLMGIMGLTAKEAAKVMRTFPNTASSRFRLAKEDLEKHLVACDALAGPQSRAAQRATL